MSDDSDSENELVEIRLSSSMGHAAAATKNDKDKDANLTSARPGYSLYIGDLTSAVTEHDLARHLSQCGVKILAVHLFANSSGSARYGHASFESEHDLSLVLRQLNYSELKNCICRMMRIGDNAKGSIDANVYIGNLSRLADSRTLYQHFAMFGDIVSCKAVPRFHRGYVQFSHPHSALRAISAMHGQYILGSQVSVQHYLTPEQRATLYGDNTLQSQLSSQQHRSSVIYATGLPEDTTAAELRRRLEPYGHIIGCYVNSQGCWAYILFSERMSLDLVRELGYEFYLHGHQVCFRDCTVSMTEADKQEIDRYAHSLQRIRTRAMIRAHPVLYHNIGLCDYVVSRADIQALAGKPLEAVHSAVNAMIYY